MSDDYNVPHLTKHETRALLHIGEVNETRKKPATISELAQETGWKSKYFTKAWQRLQPQDIVNRIEDQHRTRLELTSKGIKAFSHYSELQEIL